MAKKAELLAQAKKLKLEVTEKNTIAEIEAAIAAADTPVVEAKAEVKETTAKAGKRSAKAIAEAEEKAAKEERKSHASEEVVVAKPAPKARPLIERRGKKFREAAKLVDNTKEYSLNEALDLAVKTSTTKFDATIEVHVRLGVDPRQADQNIRANLVLPAGTGKSVKVAVFAEPDDVAKAKKAGAEIAGGDEFLQQLDKGIVDFDVLIATPAVMPKLGKYARVLGPKGLMPSPKSGTVSADVEKSVKEAKAGKVEYRVDSTGIVHLGIGKASFGVEKLQQNAQAVFASIKAAKPASIKATYVKSIFVSSSMGPGVKVVSSEI
jgi:large subunit ribosomal protein L1